VADTSAIINLNATGFAPAILKALPNRLLVVDVVSLELKTGTPRGHGDARLLQDLVTAGIVEIVKLDDGAAHYFEQLVIGPAAMTLDDGEAATIAYAAAHSGTVIIDERKGDRICRQRFPDVPIASTIDILAHSATQEHLGQENLVQAVFHALSDGRMSVLSQHTNWVVDLIGTDLAAQCPSLPTNVRRLTNPQKPEVK
jgi:predicted nucleic acid-binding protein